MLTRQVRPTKQSGASGYGKALSSRRLHLVLFSTERCNFRCHYCYEDFRLSRMPPPVVQGIKRLLDVRVPDLCRLDLSWFGGEPLVALDVVREIMAHVQDLRTRHPAVQVDSDMTTNGDLLSPGTAEELIRLGVMHYQITLDGVEPDHDAVRKRPNGRGTFAQVWESLVALKDQRLPFSVIVRIHVTRANAERLPELLTECAQAFAHDARFSFFIRPLERLGGVNDPILPVLDGHNGHETIAVLRHRAEELGLYAAPPPPPICYAAMATSWVIRANGDLNKCTVALTDSRNRVGRINPDGTLVLDPGRLAPWLQGVATGQAEDLGCPWNSLKAAHLAVSIPKSAA